MNPIMLLFLSNLYWHCFLRDSIKWEQVIPMSSSIMHQCKLPRTIFIFTLITVILHSSVQGKPNTYWSKRTGRPEFSNQMPRDGSQFLPGERKRISKPLTELPIYTFSTILRKIKWYLYSCKVSKSDGILPPSCSTLMKHNENMKL